MWHELCQDQEKYRRLNGSSSDRDNETNKRYLLKIFEKNIVVESYGYMNSQSIERCGLENNEQQSSGIKWNVYNMCILNSSV